MTSIHPDAERFENEEEDYYFDGPYLVFTATYHLKRGYCCQSGCRHCPYRFGKSAETSCDKLS